MRGATSVDDSVLMEEELATLREEFEKTKKLENEEFEQQEKLIEVESEK